MLITFRNDAAIVSHGAVKFTKRTLKNKFTIKSATLYCSMVGSKLEYASIVWQSHHRILSGWIRINSKRLGLGIWALRSIFQRDFHPKRFQVAAVWIKMWLFEYLTALWRQRRNNSIFLIHDILIERIISNALRENIVFTRLQFDIKQRNLRNTELIRMEVCGSDYTYTISVFGSIEKF